MQAIRRNTGGNQNIYPRTMSIRRLERREPGPVALDRRPATHTASFTELVEGNLPSLKRFVAAMLWHSQDVDDVVQQTLLKAFAHLDQFRFEADFKTWLKSIALNEVRQLQRHGFEMRNRTVGWDASEDRDAADGRESPQAAYERKETARVLRQAVRRLPAKYRAVVELRHLNDLSVSETAERLSLTAGTVKIRLHRARHELAGMLAGVVSGGTGPGAEAPLTLSAA